MIVSHFWMCSDSVLTVLIFFFFKQKTAYEMRISDWSSDVCSSDLFEKARLSGQGREEAMLAAVRWALENSGQYKDRECVVGGEKFQTWHPWGGAYRSEERRVGKECVSTSRSRRSPDH